MNMRFRKRKNESAALGFDGLEAHLTAMPANNAPNDCQTEPRPAAFGRARRIHTMKAVKDPSAVFRRDADPPILHDDLKSP